MQKQYLADNVGSDGKVGEHIRETSGSSVTAESIADAIVDNTDRAKVTMKLDTTAEDLRTALLSLLTGKTSYFGGLDVAELTSSELADVKAYLGIV